MIKSNLPDSVPIYTLPFLRVIETNPKNTIIR